MSDIATFIPYAPYVYLAKEDSHYHVFVLIGVQEGMKPDSEPEIVAVNQQITCTFSISQEGAPQTAGLIIIPRYFKLEEGENISINDNSELLVIAETSGQAPSIRAHKVNFRDCDELSATQIGKTFNNDIIINTPYVYLSTSLEYGKQLSVPRVMMYLKGLLERQTEAFNSQGRVTTFDFHIKVENNFEEIPIQLINPSLLHCNQLQTFYAIETPVTYRFEVDHVFNLARFIGNNHIGKRRNVCSSSDPEAVFHY